MSWLQPKLHLKVAQKQILTPGLVQMVSVLALNRLELREMINQEMVANPDARGADGRDARPPSKTTPRRRSSRRRQKKSRRPSLPILLTSSTSIPSSINIWTAAGGNGNGEHEVIEKPSFEKFISSPQGLTEHLHWQLSVTVCNETVRDIAEVIIGNLDENGYLTASLEEIAKNGNYLLEDVEEALATVQEFDPLGVAARNLRECLLDATPDARCAECVWLSKSSPNACPSGPWRPPKRNSRVPESPLAKLLQGNQLKEVARALNRPIELVKRAMDVIEASIRARDCATTRLRRGSSNRMFISARWTRDGTSS